MNANPKWQDQPGMEHLRDDAPLVQCDRCERQEWAGVLDTVGDLCRFPQPDGSYCLGVMRPKA